MPQQPIVMDFDEMVGEANKVFEPVPVGAYKASITNMELKPSQRSEYPYFNVEFTIVEGEYLKRKLWDIWSLHPKAMPFGLVKSVGRLGISLSGRKEFADYNELAAWLIPQLIGRQCTIIVSHETYEGSVRDRVKDVLAADAPVASNGNNANSGQQKLL